MEPVPFITYSHNVPAEVRPLVPSGPLVTYSLYGNDGAVLADGLDRETARMLATAPAVLDVLRRALPYLPARSDVLRDARSVMEFLESPV